MQGLGIRFSITVLAASCTWGMAGFRGCSPASAHADEACSVVASIPYWDQDKAFESFKRNVDLINYISVFWYYLAPEGSIQRYKHAREQRELIEFAHEHGVKVLALIANLPDDQREGDGNWDPVRVGDIIGSRTRRAAHIADIMALTRRMGFDGIVIDYESLPASYRKEFTLFIQELGAALHAENKLLTVDLHPKTSEDNAREDNGSHAQDWEALHPHVDQLHFMTYSQHTASSQPGPVAALEWVEGVLRYALVERKVPPAKIFTGIPLYAEEWRQLESGRFRGLDTDLTFDKVQTRQREHRVTETWSTKHESPYLEFVGKDGQKHVLWFENERSIARKLELGARLGICNIALWRLGGEDPRLWRHIRDQRHISRGKVDPDVHRPRQGPDPDAADDQDDGSDAEDHEEDSEEQDDSATEQEDEEDEEDSSTEEIDQTLVWRLSGRGHPRLAGEVDTEVEYYDQFSTADPTLGRDNWVVNVDLEQALEITPNLTLNSDIRLVLESDGGDARFYSNFPHEGIYVRKSFFHYETAHFAFLAGKYEPASNIRGYAPIYFGNYSTELDVEGSLGAGASLTFEDDAIGQHTLTAHSFYRDRWALAGELWSGRPRHTSSEPSYTGWTPNHLVTLHGGTSDSGAPLVAFSYTLGAGRRKTGLLDERVYLGAVQGMIPLGSDNELELSMDVMYLRHADGEPVDKSSFLFGITHAGASYSIGVAYSLRINELRFEPGQELKYHDLGEAGRTDHTLEIVARYDMGRFVSVHAAYQSNREGDDRDHALGIALIGFVDWLVY